MAIRRRMTGHGASAGLRALAALILVASTQLLAVDGRAAGAGPAVGETFAFNWEGRPAAPEPWVPHGWDLVVHSRDERTWRTLDPMPAQHGTDCGAPPATHMVTRYEDAAFICNNHMMTAFLPGGYGEIEMAPDQMMDWSAGTAVVSWHQSTFRTSARDWTDINVTPIQDNLVLPADVTVDLSGEPRNGIHVAMSTSIPTTFNGSVIRDFNAASLVGSGGTLEQVLTPSAVQRAHFQLEVSRTHLRFGLPDQNVWFIDQDVADLPFTRGVVQLGHHSYTPDKECTPQPGVLSCTGDTWHWSDFTMTPARVFTMLQGDNGKHISHDTPATVNFTSGAPADSHLRFAAVGAISVSFDGGRTWREPHIQPATRNREGAYRGGTFNSYWTPVPEGTTSVVFSGQDPYFAWWWVQGVSIWSTSDPALLQPADARRALPAATPPPGVSWRAPAPVAQPGHPGGPTSVLRAIRRRYEALVPAGGDGIAALAGCGLGVLLTVLAFQFGARRRRRSTPR